jgi:serpin B
MMEQTGFYSYAESPTMQMIRLPYGNGRLGMVIVLPAPGTQLSTVLSQLSPAAWQAWQGQMSESDVTLKLPRFNVEYKADLVAPLSDMGMGVAFSGGADFSGMGLPGDCVSDIIHKAILKVDEAGTVAAAATGIAVGTAVEVGPPVSMVVNRPFFLAIDDSQTGAILFMGAITSPQ